MTDLFEVFRTSDDDIEKKYPAKFTELSEHLLCDRLVVQYFATYLMETHRTPKDEFLGGSTCVQYISVLCNMICARFRDSITPKTVRFRDG